MLHILHPNIKLVPVNVSSGKETTVKYKLIGNFSKATLDGFIVKPEETDEDYVKSEINKAVKTLGQKDKNKVLYQLKQGNITVDNLQVCLEKIEVMKHF